MIGAALLCLFLAANIASIGIAVARMKRRAGNPAGGDAPPVSIVRPLCGLEPYLEATLQSGFDLDYPDYELIFCVADARDPVLPLVRRVMAANPQRPSRLFIGDVPCSANPKLNNCVRGWDGAQHDWIVLADSNVLMPTDYIQQLKAAWRPDTGLVCSTPIGAVPENFWAALECAFLNTFQARWQYVGEALGFGFAQGKSMLWYRPFLEANGGIRALGAEIAEDAAATKLVRKAGRRVHLVDAPFQQPLGRRGLADVWHRQLRWARLRRVTFAPFYAPEILTSAAVAIVGGAMAAVFGDFMTAALALVGVGIWYGAESALAVKQGWPMSGRMIAAFLVRDVILPVVWAAGWLRSRTVWRGNGMDIQSRNPTLARAEVSASAV
jgi:ceramide glucosyltransferase